MDPWLRSMVDDAMAPFGDLLEPEEVAWIAARLVELADEDPEAREARHAAHPREVDDSGERVLAGLDETVVASADEKAG